MHVYNKKILNFIIFIYVFYYIMLNNRQTETVKATPKNPTPVFLLVAR